jgi:hypothetical protein
MAPPCPGTTGPAWRRRAADVPLDRLLAPQEHASTLGAVDAGLASRRPLLVGGHADVWLRPVLPLLREADLQ